MTVGVVHRRPLESTNITFAPYRPYVSAAEPSGILCSNGNVPATPSIFGVVQLKPSSDEIAHMMGGDVALMSVVGKVWPVRKTDSSLPLSSRTTEPSLGPSGPMAIAGSDV